MDDDSGLDADQVMKLLGDKGIGTRPFFWPIHEQPVLAALGLFKGESYPVAERFARRGFYVPSGLAMNEEKVQRVAESLKDVLP
jgi:perosamine synthetase